jgi:hypothetical protein
MSKNINLDTEKGLKEALLAVAEMLETKAIIHTDPRTNFGDNPPKPNQMNFNLAVSAVSDYDCGTVACIGGWCWLLNKEMPNPRTDDGTIFYGDDAADRAEQFVRGSEYQDRNLHELFYPPFQEYADAAEKDENGEDWLFWDGLVDNYGKVTPAQAAKATRNFVENGEADWFSVMKDAQNAPEKE